MPSCGAIVTSCPRCCGSVTGQFSGWLIFKGPRLALTIFSLGRTLWSATGPEGAEGAEGADEAPAASVLALPDFKLAPFRWLSVAHLPDFAPARISAAV